jgi:hypothetical protein
MIKIFTKIDKKGFKFELLAACSGFGTDSLMIETVAHSYW